MPPIQGYEASLEAARRLLEAAETALPKDIAQAVTNAPWARILRDKHDVSALIDKIGELAKEEHFVSALHTTADKMRQHSPSAEGRPKPTTALLTTTSMPVRMLARRCPSNELTLEIRSALAAIAERFTQMYR